MVKNVLKDCAEESVGRPSALRYDGHARVAPVPLRSRRLSDLMTPEYMTPAPEVVPRMVAEGMTTLLSGREKSGKTTLAAFVAACVTSGRQFLGSSVLVGAVLWVTLEESVPQVVQRFVRMNALPPWLLLHHRLPVGCKARFDDLAAEVTKVKPRLVVIDTLASYAEGHGDENSAGGWVEVLNPIHRLAEDHKAGILILHHARKTDGGYRGSTAIGGAVDQIIQMHESDSDPSVRLLKCRGRWDIDDYRIQYDKQGCTFALAEDAVRDPREAAELRMLAALGAAPGMGKTETCRASGIRAEDARDAFERLLSRGLIQQVGARGYAVTPPPG